eukprot:2062919-Amphidinium_carterae.1
MSLRHLVIAKNSGVLPSPLRAFQTLPPKLGKRSKSACKPPEMQRSNKSQPNITRPSQATNKSYHDDNSMSRRKQC